MEQTDSHQRVGGFGDWMKEGKGDIYIYNLIHKHRLKYVYSQRKGVWEQAEVSKRGINWDGKRLCFGQRAHNAVCK